MKWCAVPYPASSIVPVEENESTLSIAFIQGELSNIMTVSALMLGFSLSFGGSADRDSMQASNREDKEFYGGLFVNYQGAFMGTSWFATCFSGLTLFCSVTTYVALRTLKPKSDTQATLFYKLFETEMNMMYVCFYIASFSSTISGYYAWTIRTRVWDKSNLHAFYTGLSFFR
jgi:hypothetical protein